MIWYLKDTFPDESKRCQSSVAIDIFQNHRQNLGRELEKSGRPSSSLSAFHDTIEGQWQCLW